MFVLSLMIEPARTDARVRFAWHPQFAVLGAVVQKLIVQAPLARHQTPVRLADEAALGADPAQVAAVAARIAPDDTPRLQLADHLEGLRPAVVVLGNLSPLVGTAIPAIAAVGPVEPHFEHLAVVRQQFAQLVAEILHISRATVFRMISVPRREIDSKLKSFFATSISQFAHHVTLTILPWRVLHRIFRIGRGPHTKTAMMLGSKDDASHTCLLTHPRPLPAVEIRGIKQLWIFIAETPFLICIGVQRIMYKRIHLHVLPPKLILGGYRSAG